MRKISYRDSIVSEGTIIANLTDGSKCQLGKVSDLHQRWWLVH